jgi:hypothetical protein
LKESFVSRPMMRASAMRSRDVLHVASQELFPDGSLVRMDDTPREFGVVRPHIGL